MDLTGCATDLVRHGENGFLHKTGDIGALAGCLERLLEDPALREAMGRRSSELIKDWSYARDIDGILEACSRLLALPKR